MEIQEPYMTKEEKDLIISYITKYKPKKILEYGIGWSTVHFSKFDFIEQYCGIEPHQGWIDTINECINKNVVKFRQCPITADYNNPVEVARYVVHDDIGPFDFIFIDGDYRYQCLEYAAKSLTPNGFCMVHDSSRTGMHPFFKHFKQHKILTNGEFNSHNDWHQGLTILWNFEGEI